MRPRLLSVLALLGAVAAASASAADRGLVVELRAQKTELTTRDDVYVRFTVRNAGARAARVYLPQTPLRDVEHDLFRVTRDGEPVAYLGIEAKRGTPTADEFATLRPGRSLSGWIELTALYDMSQPGRYAIEYRSTLGALTRSTDNVAGRVRSNEVAIDVTGEARLSPAELQEAFGTSTTGDFVTPSYTKCTASQISQLPTAIQGAQDYSSAAYTALNTSSNQTAASNDTWNRYRWWFGTYSAARYSTVTTHYQKIRDAFTSQTVGIDCGCKKTYYAYVYPNQPYKIYVCKAFWNAPMTGQDSKAGTLVHEMSHFTVTAGTDDHAYGHSACLSLATSDPAAAVDNADSHEYFAENTKTQ